RAGNAAVEAIDAGDIAESGVGVAIGQLEHGHAALPRLLQPGGHVANGAGHVQCVLAGILRRWAPSRLRLGPRLELAIPAVLGIDLASLALPVPPHALGRGLRLAVTNLAYDSVPPSRAAHSGECWAYSARARALAVFRLANPRK